MTAKQAMEIRHTFRQDKTVDVDLKEIGLCIDNALEKQIPKKPVEEIINYDYGTKSQRCPSCGNPLRHYGKPHDSYDEDYCRKCGQALDWSEENEKT